MLQNFSEVVVLQKDAQKLAPYTGWMKLYGFMKDMKDTEANLKTLGQIIALELASPQPRDIVLTRVHMRFAAMRARLEYNKLIKKAKR